MVLLYLSSLSDTADASAMRFPAQFCFQLDRIGHQSRRIPRTACHDLVGNLFAGDFFTGGMYAYSTAFGRVSRSEATQV